MSKAGMPMRRLQGAAALMLLGAALAAAAARAQTSPYRFDDGLDTSPNIPLVPTDSTAYLSFGLDERERVEAVSNALLGFSHRGGNLYDLHRLLLYANLRLDWFRVFVQLGNHTETGRAPAAIPTDIDRGDLQQGFLDATVPLDGGSALLRAGRFEMSYDDGALIGLRDGPNVRLVWDGVRSGYTSSAFDFDTFVVRPVNVSPGYFDDRDVSGQLLWGAHFDSAPAAIAPIRLNGFYYGNTMPKVVLAIGAGREETHTFGLRAALARGGFGGSIGAIVQTGRFEDRNLMTWSAHADAGVTFSTLPWSPRLGFRADALSGGGSGGTVHTFNPLYPNYAFSTEATIEAPANLIQSGAILTLHPTDRIQLEYKLEGLWRYSLQDAFYAAPTFALVRPNGNGHRWSGLEQQVRLLWQVTGRLAFAAAYVHFAPGAFLRASHAVAEDFGMSELSLRF